MQIGVGKSWTSKDTTRPVKNVYQSGDFISRERSADRINTLLKQNIAGKINANFIASFCCNHSTWVQPKSSWDENGNP